MGIRRRTRGWVALPLLACVAVSGSVARAAEWEWAVVPYLWAAGAGLDVEINDNAVLGGDIAFTDLVDLLEAAGMVHFEGRTGRTGFFVDGAYVSTADSMTIAAHPPLLPDGAAIDSELKMGRYEAAGFYRFGDEAYGFDLFLGVRMIDFDQQVDVSWTTPTPGATSASASDTLLDGYLGGRFGMPFGKRYWFNVRGDIGTGDTELSWTANAGFGIWFGTNRKYGLELAYEHFELEVQDAGDLVDVKSTCQMSGPIAGFVIRF